VLTEPAGLVLVEPEGLRLVVQLVEGDGGHADHHAGAEDPAVAQEDHQLLPQDGQAALAQGLLLLRVRILRGVLADDGGSVGRRRHQLLLLLLALHFAGLFFIGFLFDMADCGGGRCRSMPLDARKGGVSGGADGALFAANQLMAHN